MTRRTSLLALLGFALAASGLSAIDARASRPSPVIGWIEIATVPEKPDQIAIVGRAYALEGIEGRFALSIKRAGKGGSSATGQSGGFKLAAGQNGSLSRTAINVGPADMLTIELTLTVEGAEVFSVSLRPVPGATVRKT